MIDRRRLDKSIKQVDAIGRELYTFDLAKERAVQDALVGGLNTIRNTIVLAMKRTKRHPTRKYKRGRKFHRPSLEGYPPAMDSGELKDSYLFDVQKMQGTVGSKKDYSKWLEKGTGRMAARPVLVPSVDKHLPMIRKDFANAMGVSINEIYMKTGVQEI